MLISSRTFLLQYIFFMKLTRHIFLTLVLFTTSMQCQSLRTTQSQYSLVEAFPGIPNFVRPVDLQTPRDGSGRIFVVEQRGRIWVLKNNGSTITRTLFMNIENRVDDSGDEMGLLGLAFHPQFSTNKSFYVNYTAGSPRRTVVARFQVSANDSSIADSTSENILLQINQPYSNHNGGCIVFGPDNYLYIGMGDGGSGGDPQGNGQNRQTLLGKILRINVDSAATPLHYSIPADNPYVGNSQGWREEIWAYGMRNPWRFSFDSETGILYCADVGQNAHEEIDIIEKGKNYGWNTMEGIACYNPSSGCDTTGLTLPVKDYTHSVGNSVTGGYVYRGQNVPSLTGLYIYGDYVSGRIWALRYNGITVTKDTMLLDSPYSISSFGVDEANELYVLTFSAGRIYKFQAEVSVPDEHGNIPARFSLEQNYPNPFNPETQIRFTVHEARFTTLKIYDIAGKLVTTLVNEKKEAGMYSVTFNATKLTSGEYFYELKAGDFAERKKMTVVK